MHDLGRGSSVPGKFPFLEQGRGKKAERFRSLTMRNEASRWMGRWKAGTRWKGLAVAALPLFLLAGRLAAQAPANDLFVNATPIFGSIGSGGGTTVGAGVEAGEPVHHPSQANHSVWFMWTAPANGLVTFDTFG